jgi:hypothetical protein
MAPKRGFTASYHPPQVIHHYYPLIIHYSLLSASKKHAQLDADVGLAT